MQPTVFPPRPRMPCPCWWRLRSVAGRRWLRLLGGRSFQSRRGCSCCSPSGSWDENQCINYLRRRRRQQIGGQEVKIPRGWIRDWWLALRGCNCFSAENAHHGNTDIVQQRQMAPIPDWLLLNSLHLASRCCCSYSICNHPYYKTSPISRNYPSSNSFYCFDSCCDYLS